MKKILALLALVLGVVSCQTEPEGLDVNVGGEQDVTICVNIPETETRAGGNNSALGVFNNGILSDANTTMRYILQVFQGIEQQNGDITWKASKETKFKYSDGKSVTFDVRLVPNRDYKFVVWADVVTNGENDTDNHYNTHNGVDGATDLTKITIIDNDTHQWVAMDESRDAFTGVKLIEEYTSQSTINFDLKRPFAKLRVKTIDVKALTNLGIKAPFYATVEYKTPYRAGFDALESVASEAEDSNVKTHGVFKIAGYTGDNNENNMILFTDYFFAEEGDAVSFILDVYEDQAKTKLIKSNDFSTDIAVNRNYLTTIQGNILTDGNNVTVEVKDAFENANKPTDEPYYYQTISSEAELRAAINGQGGEYIVVSDIVVTGNSASTLAATRAAGDTTINLNGYTITLKADIKVESGKNITITDINENGEVGAIVSENGGGAIVNEGTLNIEGGNFGANTIENNNGVVNITGGTFESNPSNFVDDDYTVVENNGVYTPELKPVIATIGETEYHSLKKAFDAAANNSTIVLQNNETLKNSAVLAEGKTATLDLNGFAISHSDIENKYALNNHGTLTIKDSKGNGSINSRGIYNGYGNGGENVATAKLTIVNGTFNAKGTNGGAAVYNYGTVDVQGGEFTSIGGYSLNNQSGASMTIADGVTANNGLYATGATVIINGGEISGNRSGCHVIYAYNSTVTIKDGTLYNNNAGNATLMASGSSKVTINGGTFSIADGRPTLTWTSCLLDSQNSAEVVVNDGTYNGGFRVQAGTSMTINGGSFNDCYGSNYNIYGTVTVKGGTYTDAAAIAFAEKYVAEGYVLDGNKVVKDVKVAKVGNTEYRKIEDAIAAWTNNTTLTLLADVTLSDVISIKSTEYRVLDLGTYTMTAASKKDAITITPEGRSSASYALDIKADATNPGGITATGKTVVKTTGKSGVKDRPIIRFYNGVFNASNIINHSGSNGTNCPQFQFHNGVYNGTISANRALIQFYGGTFNGTLWMSVDSSAYALISGGKFKHMNNSYGSALNTEKFTIGSAKGVFDRGVYVDDEGYIVVGGPVINDFGDKFTAKATNVSKAGSYLPYSSAAENGLYYTNAQMAIDKHGEANVVVK